MDTVAEVTVHIWIKMYSKITFTGLMKSNPVLIRIVFFNLSILYVSVNVNFGTSIWLLCLLESMIT